ncbi:MAG: hypothetical protein LAT63_01510 [Marinobacter sp.]|nr:hypothetical protein [Marinobacter sp.]
MGTLLAILAVLFLALIVLVPLIERFSDRSQPQDYSNLSRWILPLMAVVIVLQMIGYFFLGR